MIDIWCAGAGTTEHNVPGSASDGDDVYWAQLLRCSAAVPAADLRAHGRAGRRSAGGRGQPGEIVSPVCISF